MMAIQSPRRRERAASEGCFWHLADIFAFAELARTLSDPNAVRRAQISANQHLQRALEWEQLQEATSRNVGASKAQN